MQIDFSQNINLLSLSPQTEFERKVVSFLEEWFSDSETVLVQTSGSTGVPKILEVEKVRMLNSAKMTCNFLGLKKGDSAFLCLPVEYISGKMMLVRSIERKLKLTIVNPTSKPLENIEQWFDFCAMSPLQVENSLAKTKNIGKLIIGGAQVSETLKKKLTQALTSSNAQTTVFETYGMSETLSHIALKELFPTDENYFSVLDGIEVSKDERGCLTIFAPKLNAEVLKTNDLVELRNLESDKFDRQQFKFLGRTDNVINSAGLKICPEELESLVKKKIANEAVFIGVTNDLLGKKLVLIIEGIQNEKLLQDLSEISYPTKNHQPKEIIFVETIPRKPNGKIDRMELKKRF